MGITNKAISTKFLKIIIRTNHGQTEIVRCDVTCSLPLQGLSFVLPVCRRWIISLEMVILDTLKWSATAWWVIPAWTIPTACSRSCWPSRGIDVRVKIQIFRMVNCLLLLTAQLMIADDLNT